MGYRSGYRRCIEQVIYCNSIDLQRAVHTNGSLFCWHFGMASGVVYSSFRILLNSERQFVYERSKVATSGLILTYTECFVRPNSDHFSCGREFYRYTTVNLYYLVLFLAYWSDNSYSHNFFQTLKMSTLHMSRKLHIIQKRTIQKSIISYNSILRN